ncbi:MAG: FKBP-type peptidyl-prolyl cis-trans isomerase [Treponema sp.]|jgi:FKBP-type peptidyl-prolyl cis-trans isomerase|nr:FKBP-type peptidyl-prolyl cis-trans isomerase [Treponema sp.]
MKLRIITILLFIAAITVHAKAIREDVNLGDEKARMSYAFGMTVGNDLKQAGLELDYSAFTEGLKNSMEQESLLMDQEEALELVQAAFENAMIKQAAESRLKEENFLAKNALNEGIITTPSGLQYTVLTKGSGPVPGPDDTVRVHYEGALTDGTVFDSSYHLERGEEIPLDMVIPGWAEGIQLMNVGSKYKIYIPSNLAYGERGAGQIIPPYSTLVFTIELLEIIKEQEQEQEDSGGK